MTGTQNFLCRSALTVCYLLMGGKFLASPGENKTDQCLFCKCFIKWDDVAAPIIRFSDDESLAGNCSKTSHINPTGQPWKIID